MDSGKSFKSESESISRYVTREDASPFFRALTDPDLAVREASLAALVRLPLEKTAWLELGQYVLALLNQLDDNEDLGSQSLSGVPAENVIWAASIIPVTSVRKRMHMLLEARCEDVRRAVAQALACLRDPLAIPQLRKDFANVDDELIQRAKYPSSGYYGPTRDSIRFWIAVDLARLGDLAALETVFYEINHQRFNTWSVFDEAITSFIQLQAKGPFPKSAEDLFKRFVAKKRLDDPIAQAIWELTSRAEDGATSEARPPSVTNADPDLENESIPLYGDLVKKVELLNRGEEPSLEDHDIDVLAHLPSNLQQDLVLRLLRQAARHEGGFSVPAMRLVEAWGSRSVPQIDDLFAIAVGAITQPRHYREALLKQIAFLLSRSEIGDLVKAMGHWLSVGSDSQRLGAAELTEFAARMGGMEFGPKFGGGTLLPETQPQDPIDDEQAYPIVCAIPDTGEWVHLEGDSLEEKGISTNIRYGRLRFPAQVQLKQRCQLIITINRKKIEGIEGQVDLELRKAKWPLKVLATLVNVQPDFIVEDGLTSGEIIVPKDEDSPPLIFTLIPQSLGPKTIRVRFEQDNCYINSARIQTEVIEEQALEAKDARVDYLPSITAQSQPPKFTIYVTQSKNLIYTISVRSDNDDPTKPARKVDEITFPKDPAMYMEERFDELNQKTSIGADAINYDDEIEKIGNNLYQNLLHGKGHKDSDGKELEGFWVYFWETMYPCSEQRVTRDGKGERYAPTVQIVTDEPYIPWEILRPFRKQESGEIFTDPLYFCQRFAMSRWLDGPRTGSNLPIRKIALVMPPSNLQYVKEEVTAFERMTHKRGFQLVKIHTLAELMEFLKSGEADVLHFACHGQFKLDKPEQSPVFMAQDEYFRPRDLTGKYLSFLSKSRPLVFLNACDSGRLGVGLTRLDGWAKVFVGDAGVGFFIGSMWKTTDKLACQFAIAFYERLQAGDSISEAVRLARETIRRSGDATYLSYTLYASPRVAATTQHP